MRCGLRGERVQETSRFLSSVVLFELTLGALDKKRMSVVSKLIESFPKNRIISPTHGVYRKSAEVFGRIFGHDSRSWPVDRLGPVNDILIGVTAFRMGATVITENEKDFSRIAACLPGFRFSVP